MSPYLIVAISIVSGILAMWIASVIKLRKFKRMKKIGER